ncbi:MAG: hypothetical protein AAF724_20835 [Pseudomonadota bacterium]
MLARLGRAGLYTTGALLLAVGVSACGSGQAAKESTNVDLLIADPAPETASPQIDHQAPADVRAAAPPAQQITELPSEPPVPTASPNELVESAPQFVAQTQPVPEPAPRQILEEEIVVTERPVATIETTETVETPTRVIERTETVETSKTIVDKVELDEMSGRAVEQVEIIERTQTTVDTVEIDKQTGTAVETIERTEPVETEREAVTVVVESAPAGRQGSKDTARLFAAAGQVEPANYRGYGVFAVRAQTVTDERDRTGMLCDAFVAALPVPRDPAEKIDMVTVWPVKSLADADDVNATSGARMCEKAVERYDDAAGEEAIADAQRTGWILDNAGPYVLAWSPPSDKGVSGASVLLVDLSDVSEPGFARDLMQRWSEDVERNDALWAVDGWNPEELSRVINDWRGEFGPRTILLLGTAGG